MKNLNFCVCTNSCHFFGCIFVWPFLSSSVCDNMAGNLPANVSLDIYQLHPFTLQLIAASVPIRLLNDAPRSRGAHSSVEARGLLYIFGGSGVQGSHTRRFSHSFRVYKHNDKRKFASAPAKPANDGSWQRRLTACATLYQHEP